jgi:hypothetical protein
MAVTPELLATKAGLAVMAALAVVLREPLVWVVRLRLLLA